MRGPDANHGETIHGALGQRIGYRLVAVDAHGGDAELDVTADLLQASGVVHGGVLFALADSLAADVVVRGVGALRAATTDASIRFLRPVSSGRLAARARLVHRGRSTVFVEVRIEAAGELVAWYGASFLMAARGA